MNQNPALGVPSQDSLLLPGPCRTPTDRQCCSPSRVCRCADHSQTSYNCQLVDGFWMLLCVRWIWDKVCMQTRWYTLYMRSYTLLSHEHPKCSICGVEYDHICIIQAYTPEEPHKQQYITRSFWWLGVSWKGFIYSLVLSLMAPQPNNLNSLNTSVYIKTWTFGGGGLGFNWIVESAMNKCVIMVFSSRC